MRTIVHNNRVTDMREMFAIYYRVVHIIKVVPEKKQTGHTTMNWFSGNNEKS